MSLSAGFLLCFAINGEPLCVHRTSSLRPAGKRQKGYETLQQRIAWVHPVGVPSFEVLKLSHVPDLEWPFLSFVLAIFTCLVELVITGYPLIIAC